MAGGGMRGAPSRAMALACPAPSRSSGRRSPGGSTEHLTAHPLRLLDRRVPTLPEGGGRSGISSSPRGYSEGGAHAPGLPGWRHWPAACCGVPRGLFDFETEWEGVWGQGGSMGGASRKG